MKESDYVLATDLARLYVLSDILGRMNSGINKAIMTHEMADVAKTIGKWTSRTQTALGMH